MWAADIFSRLFADFSLYEKDSRKSLKNSTVPLLMVHGTADDFVPCKMTKEAYAASSAPKKLLLVEGAGHGVSFLEDQENYTKHVLDFFSRYIPGFNETNI